MSPSGSAIAIPMQALNTDCQVLQILPWNCGRPTKAIVPFSADSRGGMFGYFLMLLQVLEGWSTTWPKRLGPPVGSPGNMGRAPGQPRAMLLILRISASSAFSAFVSSRSCARCPPCQALRDAVALPSGVRGPVLCFQGCHCRISSA